MTTKTEKPKTDLKNSQNRKTENPARFKQLSRKIK